jgi:hypothetical protein
MVSSRDSRAVALSGAGRGRRGWAVTAYLPARCLGGGAVCPRAPTEQTHDRVAQRMGRLDDDVRAETGHLLGQGPGVGL